MDKVVGRRTARGKGTIRLDNEGQRGIFAARCRARMRLKVDWGWQCERLLTGRTPDTNDLHAEGYGAIKTNITNRSPILAMLFLKVAIVLHRGHSARCGSEVVRMRALEKD